MPPQLEETNKPVMAFWANWKVRALGLTGFALSLVSIASAALTSNMFNSTEVIIGQVTLLFSPILALIIASVPLIVTLAIVAFIMTLLSIILQKIGI